MIKQDRVLGEMPTAREAYGTALQIAWPAVAEMMFIALIGMVDTMMVGGLGTYAIAAVGLTGQPRMMFMAILFALNIGVTAVVSRNKGAGNAVSANLCLMQGLLVGGSFSVFLAAGAFFSSEWLMIFAGAEADTLLPAMQYFEVIALAIPISALTMVITAAQRGIGNTRIALKINITANTVNVIFNYLLIHGNFGFPRLEVRGAAIATAIGNFAGLILALSSLVKKDAFLSFYQFGKLRLDKATLKVIGSISGGSVVEQVFLRIGFFICALVVAKLGTFQLAANQICMNMLNLTFTIGDGLGAASSSLVGQNLGRKRPDLSILYGKISQRLALCASALMFIIVMCIRFIFPSFFTDDPELINLAASVLIIMAVIQPFQTSQVVMAGSLRGAGDTRFVALTMFITVAIMRPLTSYLFAYPFGWALHGVWIAIIIDQIARLILLYTRFSSGKWIAKKFFPNNNRRLKNE